MCTITTEVGKLLPSQRTSVQINARASKADDQGIKKLSVVLSGLFLCMLSDGYLTGQISSMVAALQAGESDLFLSENQISWIASTMHGTCVCGFAIAAIVTEKYGRRRAVTMMSMPVFINWIITYFAKNASIFIASRVIVGVFFGGIISLSVLSTAEYTRPKHRGVMTQIVASGGPCVGITISHILGIMLSWRTVALLGAIPAALSAFLPFFWTESPTWLVSKGRFDESKTAFRHLHGTGVDAERELQILIEVERKKQSILSPEFTSVKAIFNKIRFAMKQRYFWRIAFLTMILHVYRVATGGLMIITYSITILQRISGETALLKSLLLLDGVLLPGLAISCVLRKKYRTRTLLFTSGPLAVVILIMLSSFLYFSPDDDYLPWVNSVLLAMYIITLQSGPSPILESLFGEIFPLELKTYCLFGFGIFGSALLFSSLFVTLPLIQIMGLHGVFFLHGLLSALCLLLLWFYLPETKGRTLQEIELYFKNNTFDNIKELLDGEEAKILA